MKQALYSKYHWLYTNPEFDIESPKNKLKLGIINAELYMKETEDMEPALVMNFYHGVSLVGVAYTRYHFHYKWIDKKIKEFFNSKKMDSLVKEESDITFGKIERLYEELVTP